MQRTKERVTGFGKQAVQWGLSVLPERYHWEIAARLPISNLGLPVATDDDLLESGERETERMLAQLQEYDGSFSIESSTILDIGCGAGRLLVPMASRAADSYGIDASSGFLKQCQKNANAQDVTVTLARSEDEIPDFGTTFDLVICVKTFQSIRRRLTLQYLKESYRDLVEGGILYATFPNLESESNQSKLLNEELDDAGPFRNRYFTCNEVRIYLEQIGFRNVRFLIENQTDVVREQFIVLATK